jgi:signal transduction histidine kinase
MDVLLLDRNPGRSALVVAVFAEHGDGVYIDDGRDTARLRRLLAERPPDLLVASWPLDDEASMLLENASSTVPVLLLTDHETEIPRASFAQEQLSLSGDGLQRLPRVAERITRAWRLMAELRQAAEALHESVMERKHAETELARLSAELRGLAAHLQTVREEERRRIAQGIHDELGQALTALKMDAVWLERRLSAGDPALADKTRDMIDLIGATLQSVKRLSLELRPRLLDDLGLPAALEWQTSEFSRHTGIPCAIRIRPEEIDLPREFSTSLFRIAQEALTNVARHAHATRVEVAVELDGGRLDLFVKDDGCGIRGEALRDPSAFGLMQMRERAIACGGELAIEGRPDRGTTIHVHMPFPPQRS